MIRAELARCPAALRQFDDAAEPLARCEEILAEGDDWRGRLGHVELARAAVAAAPEHHEFADAAHAAALEVFTAPTGCPCGAPQRYWCGRDGLQQQTGRLTRTPGSPASELARGRRV